MRKFHIRKEILNKDITESGKLQLFLIISAVLLSALVTLYCGTQVNRRLDENVSSRAFSELQGMARDQAALIRNELNRQIRDLEYLAGCREGAEQGESAEYGAALRALASANGWKTVGFARPDGEAFDGNGDPLGNVSGRAYFSGVAGGGAEHAVEYIRDTNLHDGPKFVFSCACRSEGTLIGVLFASMEEAELNRVILVGTGEVETAELRFIDSDGLVLGANAKGRTGSGGENFFEGIEPESYPAGTDEAALKNTMRLHRNGSWPLRHDRGSENVILVWTGVNDWYVAASADMAKSEARYEADIGAVRELILNVAAAFALMLFFIVIYSVMFLKRMSKAEKRLRFEARKNDLLLQESGGEQFVYEVGTKTVTGKGTLVRAHSSDTPRDFGTVLRELEQGYPELEPELSQLAEAVSEAAAAGETKIIDRPLLFGQGLRWVRIVLAPYREKGKSVTHVFCSMTDTTAMHRELEQSAALLRNSPGGLRRIRLSAPPVCEYLNDGFCRMLGYSEQELYGLLRDGDYLRLVYPEDVPIVRELLGSLAEGEKTLHRDYRLVRRDGTVITVSDSSESALSPEGILYSYAAVIDISETAAEREAQKQEISRLTEELRDARIRSSFSQMQPHFLYNALASIREIILEDPQYASDLVYDFTTHLRACIRAMTKSELVPFSRELENIRAYVNIERMRFGDRLRVLYDIGCDDFLIVPLSVQPLVENAIRHGVYQRGAKGGTVRVSSAETEAFYTVEVRDDGVGFDYEKLKGEVERGERDSTGLASLIFRLEKILGAEVSVKSEIGVGTCVGIRIPKTAGMEESSE